MPIFLPAAKALHAHHSDQFMQNVFRQHKVVIAIIKKSVYDQETSALFYYWIKWGFAVYSMMGGLLNKKNSHK